MAQWLTMKAKLIVSYTLLEGIGLVRFKKSGSGLVVGALNNLKSFPSNNEQKVIIFMMLIFDK